MRPADPATNSPNHPTFRTIAALLGAVTVACAASGRDAADASDPGIDQVSTSGSESDDGSSGPSLDESGPLPMLDVHMGGEVGDNRCSKVDFLFVIDNSVSMDEEQAALVSSFPGFIAAIEDVLGDAADVHVMVVDTDANTRCTPENCASPEEASVGGVAKHCLEDESGGYACTATFEECDAVLGAGVAHPAGNGASNRRCDFATGQRFMDLGEPDLGAAFACAAQVGLAGWPDETPMNAMVAALSPALGVQGACNQGFLRDDAVLVITFISDDPRYVDTGTPSQWYESVVAAKQDNAESIVVLGLVPAFEGCGSTENPDKGAHWVEFVELFGERGKVASVCEPDYASFFADSIAVIDTTCDQFVPG